MMDTMVKTKNVKSAFSGLEVLQTPARGRFGSMAAFGPPGTGKTFFFEKLGMDEDYAYIRCKYIDTPRNLLSHIVRELGEEPIGMTGKLFNSAVEQLLQKPRTLIFDESDYIINKRFVEVVRDLNDVANTPIILVGMENLERSLKRFPHLYDRMRAVVKFNTFDAGEIEKLSKDLCTSNLDKTAVDFICKAGSGKFRLTIDLFDLAQRISKQNRLKVVTGEDLQGAYHKSKLSSKAA
jgi:Cdc6-like AAA superfamily ATPase